LLWHDFIQGLTILEPPVPHKELPQAMNLKGWPVLSGLKQKHAKKIAPSNELERMALSDWP